MVRREELTSASWVEPGKQGEEPRQGWAGPSELEAGTPEQPKLQNWRSLFDRSSLWI